VLGVHVRKHKITKTENSEKFSPTLRILIIALNKIIDWLKAKGNKAEVWKNEKQTRALVCLSVTFIQSKQAYIDITKHSMSCSYSSHFSKLSAEMNGHGNLYCVRTA